MGLPVSGVECGNAHTDGAETIRLHARRGLRTIGAGRSEWAALVEISHMINAVRQFDVLDTGFGRRTVRC
jgi:hypothetical protein